MSEPRTCRGGGLLNILLVLAALAPLSCAPGDDRPVVVLYVSTDEYIARKVVAAFEQDAHVRVDLVGDTEAKKTTGLVERLRAERDNPQADVFWSSEIFQTIALAEDGVLAPHASAETAGWPARHRDPDGLWYAFAARARVIAYAPDRVAEEDIPRTWTDLTRDYLAGRIVMADPRFGTTGGHLGAMKAHWDRRAMPGFYGVRLLPSGNAGVVRAILDGEADIGLTDTDDVWAARQAGGNLALVYAPHSHEPEPGNGTLLIPNTVALVRGGPNPEAAARLVDFLLSETVERMLAESVSHNIPLRPSLAGAYPEWSVHDPLDVNLSRAAAERNRAITMAMKILTGAGSEPREETDVPDAR